MVGEQKQVRVERRQRDQYWAKQGTDQYTALSIARPPDGRLQNKRDIPIYFCSL